MYRLSPNLESLWHSFVLSANVKHAQKMREVIVAQAARRFDRRSILGIAIGNVDGHDCLRDRRVRDFL